jgi:predicted  nucleic acid-binding Zn-ribbon protein
MADSPDLIAARAAAEEAARYLAAEQDRLRKASHVVEDTANRIKVQDKRLYDGSIKNPKELGQVQEEVGHLKSRLKQQEDEVIDLMLEVERAEEASREKQDALEAVEQEAQQYRAGLSEEKDKLLQQAKVLQVKRQRFVNEVPWADLQTYERLRRAKGGVAVIEVRDGTCRGCGGRVPVSVVRAARSDTEFAHCPTCGRMLYPSGDLKFHEFDHNLDNVDR